MTEPGDDLVNWMCRRCHSGPIPEYDDRVLGLRERGDHGLHWGANRKKLMAGTIIGSFSAAQQESQLKPTLPVSLELLPTKPGVFGVNEDSNAAGIGQQLVACLMRVWVNGPGCRHRRSVNEIVRSESSDC